MTPDLRTLLGGPATDVGPTLLGATLTSDLGGATVAIELTEVEAYEGLRDPASHAFRGPTARNEVMFGPAGFLYVYFVYGMHWCANVVCGPDGTASAVLLRAGRLFDGIDTARSRRPACVRDVDLARGPARLTQCLGLDRTQNGLYLLSPGSPVRLVVPNPAEAAGAAVATGPRVGVAAARAEPLRFWLDGEPTVSTYRAGVTRRRGADVTGRRSGGVTGRRGGVGQTDRRDP